MSTIKQNAPHMIMGCVAIAAVTVLACLHVISGGEALGVIAGATGFTMATAAGSVSGSGVVGSIPASSVSPGQTLTETVSHQVAAAPATTPSNQ